MTVSLTRLMRRLRREKRANVSMVTAICAVPVFAMLGFAMDYGTALSDKSKLDNAADEAALVAIKTVKSAMQNGATFASAQAQGISQAQLAFAAAVGSLGFANVPPINVTVSQPDANRTVNVNASYSTPVSTNFSKLIGLQTIPVNGSATSTASLVTFYQFLFVVDISGSMSVGGTQATINAMSNDSTMNHCSFACHDPNHNRGSVDYRAVAKQDGYQLKIDYINSAIQNFISTMQSRTANIGGGSYSIGIDTFASTFTTLEPVPPANSNNFSDALSKASTIDIEPMMKYTTNSNGIVQQGYTYITTSLSQALASLNNIGDGTTTSSVKTYVILMSDGVEDIPGNVMYNRQTGVSYPSGCQKIKDAGATLISIAAPYPLVALSQDPDGQYQTLVQPWQPPASPSMVSAMTSCATDSTWAFVATDGPSINKAAQTALNQILSGTTRLTQ